jgi:hypothetical protein
VGVTAGAAAWLSARPVAVESASEVSDDPFKTTTAPTARTTATTPTAKKSGRRDEVRNRGSVISSLGGALGMRTAGMEGDVMTLRSPPPRREIGAAGSA